MQKVLFVLGPTAVGKSDMAICLAQEFGGEIISADSVQVYKGLDIGSAKITQDEMKAIPHHLLGICHPNDEFSVAQFVQLTKDKIEEIALRGKLPIIVGGTFLYIKALTEGYNFGGTTKHEDFRIQLEEEIEKRGREEVYKELQKISPELAKDIHPNNVKRMIRAFEIAKFGRGQESEKNPIYDCKILALSLPRDVLYSRINLRVEKMIEKGLIEEVESLLHEGVNEKSQAMQAIGYKETASYLKGEISSSEMKDLIKQHSRNYAKRQLTFLRSLNGVENYEVSSYQQAKIEIFKSVKGWMYANN